MRTKKIILSLALLCLPLFSEDIFKEAPLATQGETEQEYKEKINNLQNQKSLEHLFDNSKFPVDDYIYKAGKREPLQSNEKVKELFKEDEKSKNEKQEDKAQRQKTELENIKQLQELIKQKQNKVTKEIKIDRQTAYENKIKQMIRNEILSQRTEEIKSLEKNRHFGVDGFSNQKSQDISTNEHRLYRMVRAGRLIPAILMTAISSDLSGIVTAQIEQDIYATMGRAVLIPRGSKVIGKYTNNNKLGLERLKISWNEIITPQGVNILLTNANVSDNIGMSGAVGAINNKYWERYGVGFSLSTLSNALIIYLSGRQKNSTEQTTQLYQGTRDNIESIVGEIISQQKQIQPTIEIASGSRIFLVPSHHMWFTKPKNGEVLMRYFER